MNKVEIDFIRTKFRKILMNFPDDAVRKILTEISNFTMLDVDTAEYFLWLLTYNPQKGIRHFGFRLEGTDTTEEPFVSSDIVFSKEQCKLFRNELRYQFSQFLPGFMVNTDFELINDIKTSYTELKKAVNNDDITAFMLLQKCIIAIERNRCRYIGCRELNSWLYLLSSNNENFYFGGLRKIGFNYDEATYLKNYHLQIHDLLSELSAKYNLEGENVSQSSSQVSHEILTDSAVNEKPHIPSHKQVVEEIHHKNDETVEKALSAENILKDIALFKKFYSMLLRLDENGIDLCEVISICQSLVDNGYEIESILSKKDTLKVLFQMLENL